MSVDLVDSLIAQGVQTAAEMDVKSGRNRNAKEIPFEMDGTTYLLDSNEEWCFFNWVKEMKDRGLMLEYIYQPPSYELSPRYEYTPYPPVANKKGEVKKKFLLHPHVYTADFLIRFDASNMKLMEYLSKAFRLRTDDVKDGVLTLVVDVKGTFMSNDGGRSFSINQKLMMAVHNIHVSKVVPKEFFKKMGVPKRCTTTLRSGKASKVFKGMNFLETELKKFELA